MQKIRNFSINNAKKTNQRLDSARIIGVAIYATYFTIFPIGANAITAPGSCVGGLSDGRACTNDVDCPGGKCVFIGGGAERICCIINDVVCSAPEGQTCEEACPECYCDPCPEVDNEWSINLAQPYESRITAYVRPEGTCDCLAMYEYRCKAKYFGTDDFGNAVSSIMIPTCTICPVPKDALYVPEGELVLPGETGVTSDPGSPDVTYCYVKSGFSFEDSMGVYMFTNDCNYTE